MPSSKRPKTITIWNSLKQVERYHSTAVCIYGSQSTDSPRTVRCQAHAPGLNLPPNTPSYAEIKFGQVIHEVCVIFNGCFYFKLKPNAKVWYYCYQPERFTPSSEKTTQAMEDLKEVEYLIKDLKRKKQSVLNSMGRRAVN